MLTGVPKSGLLLEFPLDILTVFCLLLAFYEKPSLLPLQNSLFVSGAPESLVWGLMKSSVTDDVCCASGSMPRHTELLLSPALLGILWAGDDSLSNYLTFLFQVLICKKGINRSTLTSMQEVKFLIILLVVISILPLHFHISQSNIWVWPTWK